MSICGYNEQIGQGLNLLFKGMASSMAEKASKMGAIPALDHELFELRKMIEIMEGKGPIQEIFIGLNKFAEGVFLHVKNMIEVYPLNSITDVMEDIGPKFIFTVKEAEEFRESLDEPALLANNQVPIEVLANWVNEHTEEIMKIRPKGF
jgi:hypothetical protein